MGSFWFNLVLVLHILVGVAVIVFVLLQHGKGADVGASFGGGSAGSLFGSSGSANFLSRTTAVLATIFFLTSLGLTYLAGSAPRAGSRSLMEGMEQSAPVATPAAPAAPAQDSNSTEIPK
jgi:preprotein translocase subunit SecG